MKQENEIQASYSRIYNLVMKLQMVSMFLLWKPMSIADALFQQAYPDKGKKLASHYKLSYYSKREDGKGYAAAATKHINDSTTITEEELNDIAWNFYDLVDNGPQLRELCQKSKKRAKTNKTYLNYESLALLYAKSGKKRKAQKLAKRALSKVLRVASCGY